MGGAATLAGGEVARRQSSNRLLEALVIPGRRVVLLKRKEPRLRARRPYRPAHRCGLGTDGVLLVA